MLLTLLQMERIEMAKKFIVEWSETGDGLEDCDTYEEAMSILEANEREDMDDGTYRPGVYTIAMFNGSYYEGIYDSLHGLYGELK